jgi:leader peptidase (prepilin peptidase)/N-methyltransferase
LLLFVFFWGLLVGSFLNVVIHRLPRGESVIFPPSFCPVCRHRLRFWELVPLFSYLILAGHCRNCRAAISFRYPVVELLTAGLFVYAGQTYGLSKEFFFATAFLSLLLAAAFIDWEHQRVPDALVLALTAVALLFRLIVRECSWTDPLLGAVLGGGAIMAIILLTRGGMGAGDCKLMIACGLFLGLPQTALLLALTFMIGGLAAAWLIIFHKKKPGETVPFVPYIAVAFVPILFWGEGIIPWYLKVIGC